MSETILSWSTEEALAVSAVLALIAVFSFLQLWGNLKRYRLVHDTPTSKVRSAAQGHVELFGQAKMLDGEPIIAPLTAKPCCWWSYSVQRRVTHGKKIRWSQLEHGRSDGIFALDDGSGTALIDPEGAEISGALRKVWYGNSRHPSDSVSGLSVLAGQYRYTEETLPIGHALYAMGQLESQNPAANNSLRQAVGNTLKQWKQNQTALLNRFDSNKDGKLSTQEWELARQAANTEIAQQESGAAAAKPIHLLRRSNAGLPLLISTLPPLALAKRYRLRAIIAAPLFLISGSFAVYISSLHAFI